MSHFDFTAYGRRVGETDRALAQLAVHACREAALGNRRPSEARAIFTDFQSARYQASGDWRRALVLPSKVTVSKFKRSLLVGKAFGQDALEMLETARALHMNELGKEEYRGRLRLSGECDLLVDVCRAALDAKQVIGAREILSVALK